MTPYQNQNGHNRVIHVAYTRRGVSKSKKNYPAHKREFLIGRSQRNSRTSLWVSFCIDHNALAYKLNFARPYGTGHRWVTAMSTFQFPLSKIKGAYALSRLPQTLSAESVLAVRGFDQGHLLMESLSVQSSSCCRTQRCASFLEPSCYDLID